MTIWKSATPMGHTSFILSIKVGALKYFPASYYWPVLTNMGPWYYIFLVVTSNFAEGVY